MDDANRFPSVIVVDLKPESRWVQLLRRLVGCEQEQIATPLLEGLNDFDQLMALLNEDTDEQIHL
jgi:hypothetical protein